jgi:hypothetical protein
MSMDGIKGKKPDYSGLLADNFLREEQEKITGRTNQQDLYQSFSQGPLIQDYTPAYFGMPKKKTIQ